MSKTALPPKSSSAQSKDQLGALLRLPDELLSQILEDPVLNRNDMKAVALSSSRLFQLARPHFYRKDKEEAHTHEWEDEGEVCSRCWPGYYYGDDDETNEKTDDESDEESDEEANYCMENCGCELCNPKCPDSLYRQAIRGLDPDIPLLQRCIAFGGGPDNFYDPCPVVRRRCIISVLKFDLLNGFKLSPEREQATSHMCVWLHLFCLSSHERHGSEHNCSQCTSKPVRDPRTWIVMALYGYYETELRFSVDRPAVAHRYFLTIQALFENGAEISSLKQLIFHNDLPAEDGVRDAALTLVHDKTRRFWVPNKNPMALSLEKFAPAFLLELTIQQLRSEGIRIRSHHKLLELRGVEPPASQLVPSSNCDLCKKERYYNQCETCDYSRPIKTELPQLLQIIFCSLFFPQEVRYYGQETDLSSTIPWPEEIRGQVPVDMQVQRLLPNPYWTPPTLREEYDGQLADDLELKIGILDRYDVITTSEREGLEASLARLREVYRIAKNHGSYDFDQIGPLCWAVLFPSIPFPLDVGVRDNGESFVKPSREGDNPSAFRRWILISDREGSQTKEPSLRRPSGSLILRRFGRSVRNL